jgi:hypothetical protein
MRFILALAALSVATTAAAQSGQRQRMVSDACRAEIQKLCPATDRAARRECMMSNRDKLSDGCKSELRAAMEARRAARDGGNGDMATPGAMKMDPKPQ